MTIGIIFIIVSMDTYRPGECRRDFVDRLYRPLDVPRSGTEVSRVNGFDMCPYHDVIRTTDDTTDITSSILDGSDLKVRRAILFLTIL